MARALNERVPKRFRRGTHRNVAPAETLTGVRPFVRNMGITRIGNVTGLDHIGVPVAIAVRPNSRSVSVCQGKGLTLDHAFASALMEAVEQFHGEDIAGRFRLVSYRELAAGESVVDPGTLSGNGGVLDPGKEIYWIEGYDLLRCGQCWVPAEIVHTDFTVGSAWTAACFCAGPTGWRPEITCWKH